MVLVQYVMYKDIPGWHAKQGRKGGAARVASQSLAQLQENAGVMVRAKKAKARKRAEWLEAWIAKNKER